MMTSKHADERGQALTEYGLVVALVAVVSILALGTFGKQIKQAFVDASNNLTAAQK